MDRNSFKNKTGCFCQWYLFTAFQTLLKKVIFCGQRFVDDDGIKKICVDKQISKHLVTLMNTNAKSIYLSFKSINSPESSKPQKPFSDLSYSLVIVLKSKLQTHKEALI